MFKSLFITAMLFFGLSASSTKADSSQDFYAGLQQEALIRTRLDAIRSLVALINPASDVPLAATEALAASNFNQEAINRFSDTVTNQFKGVFGLPDSERADNFILFADSITRQSEIPTPASSESTFDLNPAKRAAKRLAQLLIQYYQMNQILNTLPAFNIGSEENDQAFESWIISNNYVLTGNSNDLELMRDLALSILATETSDVTDIFKENSETKWNSLQQYFKFFKQIETPFASAASITQNDVNEKRAELSGDDNNQPIEDEPIVTELSIDANFLENLAAFERNLSAASYSAYYLLSPQPGYAISPEDTKQKYLDALNYAGNKEAFVSCFETLNTAFTDLLDLSIPGDEQARIKVLNSIRMLKADLAMAVQNSQQAYLLQSVLDWYNSSAISPRLEALNSQISEAQRMGLTNAWEAFKSDLMKQFPVTSKEVVTSSSAMTAYCLITQNMHSQLWELVQNNGAGIQAYTNLFYPGVRNCAATPEDTEARYQAFMNTLNPLEAARATEIWQQYQSDILSLFSKYGS